MTEAQHPTVLIVDDHELIATSLEMALRGEGFDAVRCLGRGAAGILAEAQRFPPGGLVLLDLDLGLDENRRPVDGVTLVEPLVADGRSVLILSGTSDRLRIGGALAAGAAGWLPKRAPFPHLLMAVRNALAGRPVMPPERREELIALFREQRAAREELAAKFARLSQREREVLGDIAQGMRAQAIAAKYVVSVATIRTQIRGILTKLEVGSQIEAVALYRGNKPR